MIKLNIGCGTDIKPTTEGWVNIDSRKAHDDVVVANLLDRWAFDDSTVDEIHASHIIEHFTAEQRCWVMNEAYRVLKPDGKMTVVCPHWSNTRAYGDPTHQWPPVSDFWFYYLNREWREKEAPHTCALLSCDFPATWGYTASQELGARNSEFQQFATTNYVNAIVDIHATLTARK